MHWLDSTILLLPVLVCGVIAVRSHRYVCSVSGFMADGRHAGRYLICTDAVEASRAIAKRTYAYGAAE